MADGVERALGYRFRENEMFDLRIADAANGVFSDSPRPSLRFWIKARRTLPDDPALHAAVFAYLSDAWLNYTSVGEHVPQLLDSGGRLYVASLNHAIWFHRPLRADQWLLFDCVSPSAAAGRSLTAAHVRDAAGLLVATATQESLMAPIDD
jgi:acyl-CoA thioesterase-2